MTRNKFLIGVLAAASFVAASFVMPNAANAQADPKVAKAMAILKAETAKLGAAKTEGTDKTGDNAGVQILDKPAEA